MGTVRQFIKLIKLFRQAFGRYGLHIIILIALGFVSGLAEGIGVNALIPLFSFIAGESGVGDDIISRMIEKFFVYLNIDSTLNYLLILICLLFFIKAVIVILGAFIRVKITADYEECTRRSLLEDTLGATWPYLLKQKIGYLDTVMLVDVRHGALLLERISGLIMMVTGLLIYVLVAVNISFSITAIALLLGCILMVVFKPIIRRGKKLSKKVAIINKQIAHFINESVLGAKTIKAINVDDSIIGIGSEYFFRLKWLGIKSSLLRNIVGPLIQPISIIFICVIFAFSYNSPGFNIAALAVIIYFVQRIFTYVQQSQINLQRIIEVVPYLESVLSFQEKARESQEKNPGSSLFSLKDELEFKDVKFSYDFSDEVLSNVNFTVHRGDMVGLIGSSGAGKTTIVDLMLRLFNPVDGKILLDGADISNIDLADWRRNVGYVSQDIFLMNDTIENNIKFFADSISDEQMIEAAKTANIYDFIQSCPNKFLTNIGDRGIMLSAGQRQRIAIARVLARNPKLLILDEATSALDNESELKIQEVIEKLRGRITVVVIAHRLSTVMNSDMLLVLERGEIVERGLPNELLKDKDTYFYKMYNIRK